MDLLHGAVGLQGRNRRDDVIRVQQRLRAAGHPCGPIDGLCGRRTVSAIMSAQRRLLARPDGLVEVHGPTWRYLARPAQAAGPAAAATRSVPPVFRPSAVQAPAVVAAPLAAPAVAGRTLSYSEHLPLPARGAVNQGIRPASNRAMTDRLGLPRDSFSQDCLPPTNQAFKRMVVTGDVGPFRVTGLRPAVTSLTAIFAEVKREHPSLFEKLGTAGMMCCRNVRGSTRSISNHAWGTAIDMKIDGILVPRKANYVSLGLQLIAPIFNKHGWYWGATFGTPDPHHFECGADMLATFGD